MLGGEIARRYGSAGLPDGSIHFKFRGSAGQSFGAFVPNGVTLELEGDANDYLGKGLSGGRIIAYPPKTSSFLPEESILVGNVVLYGATSGEAFLNGIAGERFAVRNSGATAVVEGVGDHGCEYMTNGLVIVLGSTGRNFAAGMSGGIAYVYDDQGDFSTRRCNKASVDLEPLVDPADIDHVRGLLARHRDLTGSPRAAWVLEHWADAQPKFIKVFPHEYKRVLGVARAASRLRFPNRRAASGGSGRRRGAAWVRSQAFSKLNASSPRAASPTSAFKDWFEIYEPFPEEKQREQGARCMDCGVPFCHTGCPVNNLIPDWNDLVYNNRWEAAIRRLHSTNNFPEFTGRICPAPCEAACVLGINQPPVSIKLIERSIVDRAWDEGWIHPEPPEQATGKRVAVVGSGPAGLAAAQQLRRAGHSVTVFEKNDRIGGLLRYGIPNFKLEKHVVDRRIEQMKAEGVVFQTNAHVGVNVSVESLTEGFDAILLCGGAEQPRDLPIPGRELKGIHFAMEFLPQQNRRNEGDSEETLLANMKAAGSIFATGKRVVIIGGGDTGADCLGTSHRQGAKSVHQFEIMPKPPGRARRLHALAALAAATAHRKLARRRRHPRLGHQHRQVHRRRARQRQAASRRPRRPSAQV